MATSKKKTPKVPTTKEITIKVNIKKLADIEKFIKEYEKAKEFAPTEASKNNSDLCKIWEQYGGAIRFVAGIIPIKKIRKGLQILADAIDTNCATGIDEEV